MFTERRCIWIDSLLKISGDRKAFKEAFCTLSNICFHVTLCTSYCISALLFKQFFFTWQSSQNYLANKVKKNGHKDPTSHLLSYISSYMFNVISCAFDIEANQFCVHHKIFSNPSIQLASPSKKEGLENCRVFFLFFLILGIPFQETLIPVDLLQPTMINDSSI